jgi:hypothetical protein
MPLSCAAMLSLLMLSIRKRSTSAIAGALLSGILVFLVATFGFASASLFAISALIVALLVQTARVGSS